MPGAYRAGVLREVFPPEAVLLVKNTAASIIMTAQRKVLPRFGMAFSDYINSQGGVQVPTGGTAHERKHDWLRLPGRR